MFILNAGLLSGNEFAVPHWPYYPGNELSAAVHEGSWIQDTW